MNVKFIAVGRIKDSHYAAKVDTFVTRLQRFVKVGFHEIKETRPDKEANALCAALARENGYKFVLSEEGTLYTSVQFARRIETIARDLVFVIGGPEGLHEDVKAGADEILSLSPMTFVHEMAQVFVVEQVYRAFTIMHNGKYHK